MRDPNWSSFSDAASSQAALDASSQSAIRVLAAPRRLKPEEIHQLFFGLKRRNTVVVFEPRDEKVVLRRNPDLLKYAKNWLAADYLSRNAGDAAKSTEFSRIGADDKRNAVDYLKKPTSSTSRSSISVRRRCRLRVPDAKACPPPRHREQIAQHLLRTLYPASLIQEHLSARVSRHHRQESQPG